MLTPPTEPPAPDPIRRDPMDEQGMVVLPRELHAASQARTWLSEFLGLDAIERQAADAVLVVSELVTNALRHGLGEVVLRASRQPGGQVRIAVTDSGDGTPAMLPPDINRIGGLGLRIVDQVASDWGVAPFPGGKTVWATVDGPGR